MHVGPVLRGIRELDVDVLDVAPRYWPRWRFLARIPVLREFALWNCVVCSASRDRGIVVVTGGSEPLRSSPTVAGRPGISWSIVVRAHPHSPVAPETAAARLAAGWPADGSVGPPPPVGAAEGSEAELSGVANAPYTEGAPLVRVMVGPRSVVVAGHHAALDGLGLIAVLGLVVEEDLGTTSRGIRGIRAAGVVRRLVYPVARLGEALIRPPVAISSHAGAGMPGDRRPRRRSGRGSGPPAWWPQPPGQFDDGTPTAEARPPGWSSRSAHQCDRGASHGGEGGGVVSCRGAGGDHRSGCAPVAPASRPGACAWCLGPPSRARVRCDDEIGTPYGVDRARVEPGSLVPEDAVGAAEFYPSAHGRSGVAIGAIRAGGRTTLTIRARRLDFTDEEAARFLELVADLVVASSAGPGR